MEEYKYTFSRISQESYFKISDLERNVPAFVEEKEVPVTLNRDLDRIKLQIYSKTGLLMENLQEGRQPFGNSITGEGNMVEVTLDPISDVTSLFYTEGDVQILYQFLRNWYTPGLESSFEITGISADRTEVQCYSPTISLEVLEGKTQELLSRIEQEEYLPEVSLRLPNGDVHTILNAFYREENGRGFVVYKLYTPLSKEVLLGTSLLIEEEVASPVAYEVQAEFQEEGIQPLYLKGPNFEAGLLEDSFDTVSQQSYEDLLGTDVTNTFYELRSQSERQGMKLSVDFTDFENFIHFSSAEERLKIFKYKLETLEEWERKLAEAELHLPGNVQKYKTFISNLLKNMDDFERYLYFEKTDYTWPKQNNMKPYLNYASNSVEGATWYNLQIERARLWDELNPHKLSLSIPRYLREDPQNTPYLLFVDMIGNHFDNLWLYSKSFSKRYSTDHRLDQGLSRDLIKQAVESLGIKLYNASSNTATLFSLFTGETQTYEGEIIDNRVIATEGTDQEGAQPLSLKSYQEEVYKRIYHNIPLLLKTKGTETGLRALINCYGIPSSILKITQYGGTSTEALKYTGPGEPVVGSENKIRTENLFIEEPGNTLLVDSSIRTPTREYTDDQPQVEIGFNPSLLVWEELKNQLSIDFDIDDYIGDPRIAQESSYKDLNRLISNLLPTLEMEGIIRLVRFFDNSLFKILKNFIPGRTSLHSGIIIFSSPLQRSKQPQPRLQTDTLERESIFSGTTLQAEASHGGVLTGEVNYTGSVNTPNGPLQKPVLKESPRYTGELESRNVLQAGGMELNSENLYKYFHTGSLKYNNDYNATENNILRGRTSTKVYKDMVVVETETPTTGSVHNGIEEYLSDPAINTRIEYDSTNATKFYVPSRLVVNVVGGLHSAGFYMWNLTELDKENRKELFLEIRKKNNPSGSWIPITVENYSYDEGTDTVTYFTPYVLEAPLEFLLFEEAARLGLEDHGANIQVRSILSTGLTLVPDHQKTEVQDYLYQSEGLSRARRKGTKTSSRGVNLREDLMSTYGKNSPVEQTGAFLGYISSIEDPYPVLNDSLYLKIPYLVDENGGLTEIKAGKAEERNFQELFQEQEVSQISLTVPPNQNKLEELNGNIELNKVGKTYVPVIYSQTGGTTYTNFLPFRSTVGDYNFRSGSINYSFTAKGLLPFPSGTSLDTATSSVQPYPIEYSIGRTYMDTREYLGGTLKALEPFRGVGANQYRIVAFKAVKSGSANDQVYETDGTYFLEYTYGFTTSPLIRVGNNWPGTNEKSLVLNTVSRERDIISGVGLQNLFGQDQYIETDFRDVKVKIHMKDKTHTLHGKDLILMKDGVKLYPSNYFHWTSFMLNRSYYRKGALLDFGPMMVEILRSMVERDFGSSLVNSLALTDFNFFEWSIRTRVNEEKVGAPRTLSYIPSGETIERYKSPTFVSEIQFLVPYSKGSEQISVKVNPLEAGDLPCYSTVEVIHRENPIQLKSINTETSRFWSFKGSPPTDSSIAVYLRYFQSTDPGPFDPLPSSSLSGQDGATRYWYNPEEELFQLYSYTETSPGTGSWTGPTPVDPSGVYWTTTWFPPTVENYQNWKTRVPEEELYIWEPDSSGETGRGKLSNRMLNKLYLNSEALSKEHGRGTVIQEEIQYIPTVSSRFPEKVEPPKTRIPAPSLPFEIKVGDEIRFENREEYTYKVMKVTENVMVYDSVVGRKETVEIEVDRSIPYTVNLNFFLVRRLIPGRGNVIVKKIFPYTQTPSVFTDTPETVGFLLPEYPSSGIESNIKKITENLISKQF